MTGSNDHNQDQNITSAINTTMCRNGCGFYGSSSNDGMCSKCFKDHLKRTNQTATPTPTAASAASNLLASQTATTTASTTIPETVNPSSKQDQILPQSDLDIGSPLTPDIAPPSTLSPISSSPIKQYSISDQVSPNSGEKKVKKNRCTECKKKVGLTGFTCRCGGLYCSEHRYSDKHECSFDYHEMGQSQIRKANPVVMGTKVDKI